MQTYQGFEALENYLLRIPAIKPSIDTGFFEDGNWWAIFNIDIHSPLAWQVVQELGYALNDASFDNPLPIAFMPVSPPPYLNGGPSEYLSWVIQSKRPEFSPAQCAEWMIGQMPRPVEEVEQWMLVA
jgi:hypothetical protein